MASYNKVILLGNLTRDPALSYLPSQTAVVGFGLATNRKWKGQDGTAKEKACFVDCKAFGKQAETLNQYLHKGDPVLVEGRLDLNQWESKDGQKRSKIEVVVERFTFIPKSEQQPATQTTPPQPAPTPNPTDPGQPSLSDPNDPIPF